MSSNNIWVIDDDRSIRWVLEKALTRAKMEVTTFENANGVMNKLDPNGTKRTSSVGTAA